MSSRLDPINRVVTALSEHRLQHSIHVQQIQGGASSGAVNVILSRNDDNRAAELPFDTAMELLGREQRWSFEDFWSELEQLGFTEDSAANVRGLRNPGGSSIRTNSDDPSRDQ